MKITENKKIIRWFFELYLKLRKFESFENISETKSLIPGTDMVRHQDRIAKYTWSYSNESVSVFGIYLPFGFSLFFEDFGCRSKKLYLDKQHLPF